MELLMGKSTSIAISVIMTVYNVEKHIRRAIESVLGQTFTDFELICIDDGSTDNSGKICDEYALRDSRIKVFHRGMNGGIASARQFGYDMMQGEYSIHCDSDDWIESDMLKSLYEAAKTNNSDIIISDFYINSDTEQKYYKQIVKEDSIANTNLILSLRLHGSLCNKLISNRLIWDNKIKFSEKVRFGEDEIVLIQILKKAPKVSYLPKAFYHYYRNPTGTMATVNKSAENYIKRFEILRLHELMLSEKDYEIGLINRKLMLKFNLLANYNLKRSKYLSISNISYKEIIASTISFSQKMHLFLAQIGFYFSIKALLKIRSKLS